MSLRTNNPVTASARSNLRALRPLLEELAIAEELYGDEATQEHKARVQRAREQVLAALTARRIETARAKSA